MAKPAPYLGELELVVLLALHRLPGPAYGMAVYDELVQTTGRDLTAPTVYITLSRLEKKGYVQSRIGEPAPHRGGRAKRFFEVTLEGERAMRRSREMLERLWGERVPQRPVS